ncbi:TPA: serine acetyltransferase [Enterococcus faecium]|uniref:serine O-acetyltransferase n=1 Tax=Enterococcus faecium TaxID=1352 RepID=UPI0002A29E07|nr:serine acetyltransferase [Enterococcus faecium]ELA59274.1 hypothetical protein OGG_03553 [Enterococcus faecium EnGen0013]EOF93735.1 hypothetical protein SKG_01152 [Enterococcus faecium EnGen0166]MDV7710305.1 serine acetyltransferase [Enterococcus faecium]MDW3723003.1 serine acetyltransferase [Enterococcus faecium]HAQ7384505.1 serine acetyltransferase [Enterococcus faecium]
MIKSKEDYRLYLEADKRALGKNYSSPKFVGDEIWKFQRLMRKTEYYKNCSKTLLGKIYSAWLQYRYYQFRIRLGFSIPLNVFDAGLSIAHFGTIVVNGNARVGKNCRIQECVTIGATNGSERAPTLGNNIFIGSGARIIGGIEIADDIAIGANAVVTKSFLEPSITIAGVPAKKISNNNSHLNMAKGLFDDISK